MFAHCEPTRRRRYDLPHGLTHRAISMLARGISCVFAWAAAEQHMFAWGLFGRESAWLLQTGLHNFLTHFYTHWINTKERTNTSTLCVFEENTEKLWRLFQMGFHTHAFARSLHESICSLIGRVYIRHGVRRRQIDGVSRWCKSVGCSAWKICAALNLWMKQNCFD